MTIQWLAAEWPLAHVVAGTTMRAGGVSRGPYASLNLAAHVGDDDAAVAENRRRMRNGLSVPGEPLWLEQVHGCAVVRSDEVAPGGAAPMADAAIALQGDAVLGILTADCLPVLVCSLTRKELAAMHCGWRSLAGGIVAATVAALASDPANLVAWLGPAISQPYYEVGDEVRDTFLAGVEDAASCFLPNDRGRWQADLYGLARRYLAAVGVSRVYGGGFCTYAEATRFYSYRRDGTTGRMATLIWSAPSP